MRKLILIVHISLDGYAAGENGEFDNFNPSPENLDFVCQLTDQADGLLAGRVSFEMLEKYWPTAFKNKNATPAEIEYSNWYNGAEKIVLSGTLPPVTLNNTTILSEDIGSRLLEIKNRRGKNILMFGSPTAYQFLDAHNLIDEYYVISYPVLFGKGLPFFTRAQNKKRFKLLDTLELSQGEIALHYKIK